MKIDNCTIRMVLLIGVTLVTYKSISYLEQHEKFITDNRVCMEVVNEDVELFHTKHIVTFDRQRIEQLLKIAPVVNDNVSKANNTVAHAIIFD